MITVDSCIPFIPKERAVITPKPIVNAMERYSEAYKAVYGILPHMEWDGVYIRIHGQPQGVTLQRLKEMAQQLRWRAG